MAQNEIEGPLSHPLSPVHPLPRAPSPTLSHSPGLGRLGSLASSPAPQRSRLPPDLDAERRALV